MKYFQLEYFPIYGVSNVHTLLRHGSWCNSYYLLACVLIVSVGSN